MKKISCGITCHEKNSWLINQFCKFQSQPLRSTMQRIKEHRCGPYCPDEKVFKGSNLLPAPDVRCPKFQRRIHDPNIWIPAPTKPKPLRNPNIFLWNTEAWDNLSYSPKSREYTQKYWLYSIIYVTLELFVCSVNKKNVNKQEKSLIFTCCMT